MSPDIMYFFQMNGEEDYRHTLPGIFIFDLPATLLLTLVFHLWIRNTIILYLPSPLNRRFAKYLPQNIFLYLRKKWYIVLFSALLGAISHILWDQLGNPDGLIYAQAPDFFGKQLQIGPFHYKVYVYIEYIGSLIGLLFIGWVFFKEPGEEPLPHVSTTSKFAFWLCMFVITGAVIAIKLIVDERRFSIGPLFVIAISGLFLAIVVTCMLFNLRKRNSQVPDYP